MRKSSKILMAALAAGFALASVAPQAGAQQRYYGDDDDVMEAPAPPPPCDPPEFKRTDGRCDSGIGGIR